LTDKEQTLLDIYRDLPDHDALTLLRFAEFLASGAAPVMHAPAATEEVSAAQEVEVQEIPKPVLIERPENEKVVDALKRLSASYPMLEKKHLLDKASALVAQHIMFGQPAELVINQIEDMFKQAYEKFVEEAEG